MKTNWRVKIAEAMKEYGESFVDVEAVTFTGDELDRIFDNCYGTTEGTPFTVWTAKRVYFPVCYDGAEWVSSVPRHPNGEATKHIGGG